MFVHIACRFPPQIPHFKKMLREAGKTDDVSELEVAKSQLQSLVQPYETALKQIPDILKVGRQLATGTAMSECTTRT